MSCRGIVFTNWVLPLISGNQPIALGIDWGWGAEYFCGATLTNISIRCDPLMELEVSFGEKRWLFETLSFLFFFFLVVPIRFLSYMYILKKPLPI